MTDETFMEELELAEAELMDDYVAGRLADAERAEFERNFLSTDERRARLRFARMLDRYAKAAPSSGKAGEGAAATASSNTPTPGRSPTFGERVRAFWAGQSAAARAGLAFAAVAVIAVAVWVAIPRAPRTFAALTLVAGAGERAGGLEVPKVRLPLGADALKVTLTLPAGAAPAPAYRAEMLTGSSRKETVEVSGHDGRSVTVVLTEGRLARGRHALTLFAVGADGASQRVGDSYVFDVE